MPPVSLAPEVFPLYAPETLLINYDARIIS